MSETTAEINAIRLASTEPLESLKDRLQQIANQFGTGLSIEKSICQNAPFCGYELYIQRILLEKTPDAADNKQVENCVEAIKRLTEEAVADGYVELL